jgi:hypothetical protein
MSSPAQTLGSWVGIPFEAGYPLAFIVVLSCVCVEVLHGAHNPVEGILPREYRIKNVTIGQNPTKGHKAIGIEYVQIRNHKCMLIPISLLGNG